MLTIFMVMRCEKSFEPVETSGDIAGFAMSIAGDAAVIYPAFIFAGDSLITTTTKNGDFTISSLHEGYYSYTCSALNFRDTPLQVQVVGGTTTTVVFAMTPDSSTGRVYAEFQDNTLLQEALMTDSSLSEWSEKELFDGVTGATLQSKTLRMKLPDRKIFFADSLIAISDDFGQCWITLLAQKSIIKLIVFSALSYCLLHLIRFWSEFSV
ncbi:carboxypeptidase regulatory-like domain-containing protein [candidate division KSB1 bacterium]|nr:hypothetical protein [candidate division KSB1 bacterium]RQV99746.1 MAG: carboxypeptidase regulatory-like domain-containing protein [candidate division KSB1 bacterium]